MTIEFESEKPVIKGNDTFCPFEKGLPYFVGHSDADSLNNTFVYGTGKTKLKKVSK